MDTQIGTATRPLRVAIIGAGPSGFYAAGALLEQSAIELSIDLFDRLPTPFGLVRHGVAPDHQKIKSVTKVYDRIASDSRLRFFGNVTFGVHLPRSALRDFYDVVIYAVGSPSDRKLNIPGEELRGSHSATEFVGWYNGHPDFVDLDFDLSGRRVAVVGNGNVAVDVVRVLARKAETLAQTDVADEALAQLAESQIETVTMLGRRGPAQAAFTNPELRELGEVANADLIVVPDDLVLDPCSEAVLATDREAARNVETLRGYAARPREGRPRQIVLRFLVSPVEILGEDGRVTGLRLQHNELRPTDDGYLQAYGLDSYETIPVDLVFRAIGYKGLPLPGLPYDKRRGTVPNEGGRIVEPETGAVIPGEYVVGWVKRGPTGVIGTNKADAVETVRHLLEDVPHLVPVAARCADPAAAEAFIRAQQPEVVTYADWRHLDQVEVARGKPQGRPRVKVTRIPEMLDTIRTAKAES